MRRVSRLRYHNHGGQGKEMEEAIRRESDPLVCVVDTELLVAKKSKSRSVLFFGPVVWRHRVVPGHECLVQMDRGSIGAHSEETDHQYSAQRPRSAPVLLVWELLSLQAPATARLPKYGEFQPIAANYKPPWAKASTVPLVHISRPVALFSSSSIEPFRFINPRYLIFAGVPIHQLNRAGSIHRGIVNIRERIYNMKNPTKFIMYWSRTCYAS